MKEEYDFSTGERGKFYREDSQHNPPVYLDKEVRAYLVERARLKGVDFSELVNEMLKQEIHLIESVK